MKPSPEALQAATEWLAPRVRVTAAEVESLALAFDAFARERVAEALGPLQLTAKLIVNSVSGANETRASIVRFLRRLGNEYSNDANWHADRIEAREDEREEPK